MKGEYVSYNRGTDNPHYSHGLTGTPTYKVWGDMIQRCTNPKSRAYKWYGGRGITVCEQWLNFNNFYADMGERPIGLTLERIDNDKGYEPANCRWATMSEQLHNKRPGGRRKITPAIAQEIRVAVGAQQELARRYGLSQTTISEIKRKAIWKNI